MITTLDVLDLVYLDVKKLGLKTYKYPNIPDNLTGERVTINVKESQSEKIWKKCFVNVNFIVPDLESGMNIPRLKELERLALKQLDKNSKYDGTSYRYSVYSSHPEKGEKFNYVNIKLLFEILNTK